ncbi:unnamed protein product, partial [Iphiclides podalirius]
MRAAESRRGYHGPRRFGSARSFTPLVFAHNQVSLNPSLASNGCHWPRAHSGAPVNPRFWGTIEAANEINKHGTNCALGN